MRPDNFHNSFRMSAFISRKWPNGVGIPTIVIVQMENLLCCCILIRRMHLCKIFVTNLDRNEGLCSVALNSMKSILFTINQ